MGGYSTYLDMWYFRIPEIFRMSEKKRFFLFPHLNVMKFNLFAHICYDIYISTLQFSLCLRKIFIQTEYWTKTAVTSDKIIVTFSISVWNHLHDQIIMISLLKINEYLAQWRNVIFYSDAWFSIACDPSRNVLISEFHISVQILFQGFNCR